jgi:dihydrofolate reductase
MTRQVSLYIFNELDGYIAKDNDNRVSFTSRISRRKYGYFAFLKESDMVILGRKTYYKVLSFRIEYPYKDKTNEG